MLNVNLDNESNVKAQGRTNAPSREIQAFDHFVARGLRLGKDQTNTSVFSISPDLAQHILDRHHGHNRKLNKSHVDILRRAIRAGEWRLTAQGISINSEGRLDDGQHRMNAIIAAQRPALLHVTVNSDPTGFEVMDTGRKRTSADVLSIDGFVNCNSLAAAVRTLIAIERGLQRDSWKASNTEVLEFAQAHPELHECMNDAARIRSQLKVPDASSATALFLIQTDTNCSAHYDEFVQRLTDGAELDADSPILILRNYLLRRAYSANNGRSSRMFMVGSVIKAWNAFVTGRKVSRIGHADATKLPAVK